MMLIAVSMAMSSICAPTLCFQCESFGVSGAGTSLVRSIVDAVAANPQRAGVTQDIWSSTMRSVTGIMPPQNTSCDMIATTSSGMICSFDLASAESAKPTVAAATQATATSMNSSTVGLGNIAPLVTDPLPHPLPTTLIAVTIPACITANTVKTQILANRYAVVDNPTACSR